MKPELRITLVQPDTIWHDAPANRARLAAAVHGLAKHTDLIVLPETFSTGFSNEAIHSAESMNGPTVAWVRELAAHTGAAVTGSLQIREGEGVFNRLVFATPDGQLATYDKRHLFRMSGEHERYAAGSTRITIEWQGWRICPLVCYDLRFPVFSRNRVREVGAMEYDLALYVANWPAARHEAWRTLLRARAIENLSYVVGVNRVGNDGNGHAHAGGSAVIDPTGTTLLELDGVPAVSTVTIDQQRLVQHRERFPAWRDADDFIITDRR